jgi:hypothetical protein
VLHRLDTVPQQGLAASECAHDTMPWYGSTDSEQTIKAPLQQTMTISKHKECLHEMTPQHGSTDCEQTLKVLLQVATIIHEHKHKLELKPLPWVTLTECISPTRGDSDAQVPDLPLRTGAVEHPQPLQNAPQMGMLIALRVMGTCRPERKPPWEAISKSTRQPWLHQIQVSSVAIITAKSGHIPLAKLLLSQAPAIVAISWLKCHHHHCFEVRQVAINMTISDNAEQCQPVGKNVGNAASLWPSHIYHTCVTCILMPCCSLCAAHTGTTINHVPLELV